MKGGGEGRTTLLVEFREDCGGVGIAEYSSIWAEIEVGTKRRVTWELRPTLDPERKVVGHLEKKIAWHEK